MGLRLGIDLDGVVADFNAGWMRLYNERFETDLTPDMVQFWDGLHELTHFEDMRGFWRWARDHDGHSLFHHLDPYPDAIPTLERLRAKGHDIVIITAKPTWSIHDTFQWVGRHALPTREVHMSERKWEVPVDVYLDDSPYVVPDLVEKRPESVVCRFVRAWNEPVEGARDVTSWREFESTVDEVVRERGGDSRVPLG